MQTIAALNDATRQFNTGGTIFITAGIAALPVDDQAAILDRVRTFDDFTPDNDPYGEHDFGSFEYAGKTIMWKITTQTTIIRQAPMNVVARPVCCEIHCAAVLNTEAGASFVLLVEPPWAHMLSHRSAEEPKPCI